MNHDNYIYILVMALVTYLIRLLPITLIQKEIKNKTIRSFLYYVPFVTLAVMTFPEIFNSTDSVLSGIGGLIVAIVVAYRGKSLVRVSLSSCISIFIIELFI